MCKLGGTLEYFDVAIPHLIKLVERIDFGAVMRLEHVTLSCPEAFKF